MKRKEREAKVEELREFRQEVRGFVAGIFVDDPENHGCTNDEYQRGFQLGASARSSILSAAQQQGNEGPSENERLRQEIDRQERELARRKREAERQWTDLQPLAGNPPEQADERCPSCYETDCQCEAIWQQKRGTGKKPTQGGNPDLGYGGARPLLPPRTTQTALRHAIQDRDKALARAEAAERERDEYRAVYRKEVQIHTEDIQRRQRAVDRADAAESREAKLREAIERHRNGEITFRELWAVLEGESE